jgi:hypothetical protein
VHEKVLVVLEGRAAGEALGRRPRRSTRPWSASSIRSAFMNDQELREMIRESIARHTGAATEPPRPSRVRRFIPSHLRLHDFRSGDDDARV